MIVVRPARLDDYPRFVGWFAELQVDDPLPSAATWERMVPGAWVAEVDGEPAGYLYHQLLGELGYVRNVVSDPARRRLGVGRALMEASMAQIRAAGLRRWCLNVKPGNTAARALYESLGMTARHAAVALRFPWVLVDDLPTQPARVHTVDAADDAAFEGRFDLARGLLAEHRGQGRVLLGLRGDAGAVEGVASYSRDYPGAFPFRVSRPSLAGALLSALRPHARQDLAHMQVVAEDDAGLEALLVGAGAEVRMRILHYEGEVAPVP